MESIIYFKWILIGVGILAVCAVVVVVAIRRWRKAKKDPPLAFRKALIKTSCIVMKVEKVMKKHYIVVLLIYLLIFIAFYTQVAGLQWIGSVGKKILYCFYGLAMFNLVVLYFARLLLDPVPKDAKLDAPEALDPNKAELLPLDSSGRFDQLIKLGEEAFAAWGGSADDRCIAYRKFLEGNADSFRLVKLKDADEPIGFSCILPIRESAYRQFRLGILDSWDFAWEDILQTSKYLCVNAIYLQRKARGKDVRAIRIICSHIASFVSLTNTFPILVASGLTREGRRLLERCGFESYHRTKDHATPIYELDLSITGTLNDRARFFVLYLQKALDSARSAKLQPGSPDDALKTAYSADGTGSGNGGSESLGLSAVEARTSKKPI